jgi:hypothetical protein
LFISVRTNICIICNFRTNFVENNLNSTYQLIYTNLLLRTISFSFKGSQRVLKANLKKYIKFCRLTSAETDE